MTVIHGIQGYGKTGLVVSCLERLPPDDATVLWLSAVGLDLDDPMRLADQLSRTMTAAGVRAVGTSTASGWASLDEALAAEDRKVVLVIDDFHEVCDEGVLSELVRLAARHRGFHLIVCSRGSHSIQPLTKALVDICVIPPSDLLFTVQEVVDLATLMGHRIDDREAGRLHASVGGWVAPLRLMVGSYQAGGDPPLRVAEEYLRTVVLPGIRDQGVLDLALRFSLPGRLDERLVRHLSQGAGTASGLVTLTATGLCERRDEGGQRLFIMPGVLRTVLRDAYVASRPEEVTATHRRLALWFLEHEGKDGALPALEHAVAAHDWPLAAAVWSRHAEILLFDSPAAAVRDCLDPIPEDAIEAHPGLLIGRATSQAKVGDSGESRWTAALRAYAEASRPIIQQRFRELSLSDLVYAGIGQVIGLRLQGRFAEADEFAAKLEEKTAESGMSHVPSGRMQGFYLTRGLTQTLAGRDDEAIRWYRRTHEGGSRANVAGFSAHAAANLTLTYAMHGDHVRARQWLDEHHRLQAGGLRCRDHVAVGAQLSLGLMALDRLDRAGIGSVLAHLADGSAPVDLWPFIAYLYAQDALIFGDPAKALAVLDDVQRAHIPALSANGIAPLLLARARADLLVAERRAQEALHLLGAQEGSGPILAVPQALIWLLSGEYASARTLARRVLACPLSARDRLDLLVIAASAAFRMEGGEVAHRLAREAVALCRQTGILRSFTLAPRSLLAEMFGRFDEGLDSDEIAALEALRAVYPDHAELVRLTRRERSILAALEKSNSRQEIADSLFLSINTVKSELKSLYRKLGTSTREATLLRAAQLGLLNPSGN